MIKLDFGTSVKRGKRIESNDGTTHYYRGSFVKNKIVNTAVDSKEKKKCLLFIF